MKKRYCEKDESALQPDVIEGCDRAILDHRASYYSSLIFTGEPHRMLHPSHAEHCIRDDPQEKEDLSGKVLRAARRFTHLHCKLTGPRGYALATAAGERSSNANSTVLHTSFLQKSFSGAGLRGPCEAAECKSKNLIQECCHLVQASVLYCGPLQAISQVLQPGESRLYKKVVTIQTVLE